MATSNDMWACSRLGVALRRGEGVWAARSGHLVCGAVSDIGVADPLVPDVPVVVLRLISQVYFGFEDAVTSAFEDVIRAKYPGASADKFWSQFLERPFTFTGKFTVGISYHQRHHPEMQNMVTKMVPDYFELHRRQRNSFVFDRPK
jgi:hypothetical protein